MTFTLNTSTTAVLILNRRWQARSGFGFTKIVYADVFLFKISYGGEINTPLGKTCAFEESVDAIFPLKFWLNSK